MESTDQTRDMAQSVLDYIHKHPEDHKQAYFFGDEDSLNDPKDGGSCGTTMCIAGTATWLEFGRASVSHNTEWAASHLLGLDPHEARVLFYDMDEERALQKLKKVAVGEDFGIEDYLIAEHHPVDDYENLAFDSDAAHKAGFPVDEIVKLENSHFTF